MTRPPIAENGDFIRLLLRRLSTFGTRPHREVLAREGSGLNAINTNRRGEPGSHPTSRAVATSTAKRPTPDLAPSPRRKNGAKIKRKSTCIVAYRGPSEINGAPILAVVHTLGGSKNRKTGRVVNIAFMPADVAPHHAIKTGEDVAVCGGCVHRPASGGTCYVIVPRHVSSVWRAARDAPPDIDAALDAIRNSGLPVRFGSYGEPTSVPFEVLERLVAASTPPGSRPQHVGYTSQWRTCDQRFNRFLMASVTSPAERAEARRMGWHTFRIRTSDMPVLPGERICPATPEGGKKTTCSECLACTGASAKSDIVVVAHGSTNKVRKLETLLRLRRNRDDHAA